MDANYYLEVKGTGENNLYEITWTNRNEVEECRFTASAGDFLHHIAGNRWERDNDLRMEIGQKLFDFINGDSGCFEAASKYAGKKGQKLRIFLKTDNACADWPFELLADNRKFLLPQGVNLIRRVSDFGERETAELEIRPPKLLFMACSAREIKPLLDYEGEEEAIVQAIEEFPVELEFEDSGSLDGLKDRLLHEKYDIVHLSGHAGIDENTGEPYFVMEDAAGLPMYVGPEQLWDDVLIENSPRLLFLSGCATGKPSPNEPAGAFADQLARKFEIPAVLGWGHSVSDKQAIKAEEILYGQLSRGINIIEAVQMVRYRLFKSSEDDPPEKVPAWCQLRLYSTWNPLNALVKYEKKRLPVKAHLIQNLDFIGRRRQLQHCLRTLKLQNLDKTGVLILGSAGMGKSKLARKVCSRLPDYTPISIDGELNETIFSSALRDSFIKTQDKQGETKLNTKEPLKRKIANLCPTSFRDNNYLIVLDNFHLNLEGASEGKPGKVKLDAVNVLKTLLQHLPKAGGMTRLIITSRYLFTLNDKSRDLVDDSLEKIWLTGFSPMEQRKKMQRLNHIRNIEDFRIPDVVRQIAAGNPLLMENIDKMAGRHSGAQFEVLYNGALDERETFIDEHLIRRLMETGGYKLASFLQCMSVFRVPVKIEAVHRAAKIAGKADAGDLLTKGLGRGLMEWKQDRQTYRVIPLLRDELLLELLKSGRRPACETAAYEYYKNECENEEDAEPVLIEEWIHHAMECGEYDTVLTEGAKLVKHYRERLELKKSHRISLWILNRNEEQGLMYETEPERTFLTEMALTLHRTGQFRDAYKFFLLAKKIDEMLYGCSHHLLAEDYLHMGNVLRDLIIPNKAIASLNEALTILSELPGDDHIGLEIAIRQSLGACHYDKADKKAIEHFEKVLELCKKIYDEPHPMISGSLLNLGAAYLDPGRYDDAFACFEDALKIGRELYGDSHPHIAAILLGRCEYWSKRKNFEKALNDCYAALNINRRVLGDHHPDTATALNNMGVVYIDLKQPDRAIAYFREALDIYLECLGEKNIRVAGVYINHGEALRVQGKNKNALEYCLRGLEIDRGLDFCPPPNLIRDLEKAGEICMVLGKKEKAREYFKDAHAIAAKFFGPDHHITKRFA